MNILDIQKDGFRMDNTDGYTQSKIDQLNNELENRLTVMDVKTGDPEYYDVIKQFDDEVARTMRIQYRYL